MIPIIRLCWVSGIDFSGGIVIGEEAKFFALQYWRGCLIKYPAKKVALPLRRATAQPLFPLSRRSDSRDGNCACTRDSRLFCIPACASGGSPPVGACPSFDEPLAVPKDAAPVGFCSGGFTSTSSLRSGQRGSTEVERRRYPEADHCLASAVAFLSARPERSLPTISLRQAFRLQHEASMAVDSTACYCPRTACHHIVRRSSRWSRSP